MPSRVQSTRAKPETLRAQDIQVGDEVLVWGEYRRVVRVQAARGRRPPTGRNLHLFLGAEERLLRIHSEAGLEVRPSR